jgi:hypothetical protein
MLGFLRKQSPTNTTGQVDGAAAFNGTSQYVDAGSSSSLALAASDVTLKARDLEPIHGSLHTHPSELAQSSANRNRHLLAAMPGHQKNYRISRRCAGKAGHGIAA